MAGAGVGVPVAQKAPTRAAVMDAWCNAVTLHGNEVGTEGHVKGVGEEGKPATQAAPQSDPRSPSAAGMRSVGYSSSVWGPPACTRKTLCMLRTLWQGNLAPTLTQGHDITGFQDTSHSRSAVSWRPRNL